MAWNAPKIDWATGNLVAASDLNDIGNNLAYLKSPPSAQYVLNEASNYTTTSGSLVDIDATIGKLALQVTPAGTDVMVHFHGTFAHGTSDRIWLEVAVGTGSPPSSFVAVGGDNGVIFQTVSGFQTLSFTRLVTGLTPGTLYTFKMQWRTIASTATLYAGAGSTNADNHPQFWVREVS